MAYKQMIFWEPGRDQHKDLPWVVRDSGDHVILSAPTLHKAAAHAPDAFIDQVGFKKYMESMVALAREKMPTE